jgi:predicted CXXCH cytochrome family protein
MQKCLVLLVCLLFTPFAMAASNVADTPHNLSVSGKGQFRSNTEDRICIFCHISHTASPDAPIWNRRSNGYTSYKSSSTDAATGKPMGSSALCLSCHDGTIALGDMLSNNRGRGRDNDLRNSFLRGRSNLGTDLSNDHPVSIVYDASLQLTDPDLVNPASVVLPLEQGEIQCISCHDPHSDRIPPFLQKTTMNGELCTSCHLYSGRGWDWASSSHAASNARPRGANPWPERKPQWAGQNVSENACMNCHAPHNAASPARLVKDLEEETCYRCHDGSVAQTNIRADMRKFYRHGVEQTPNIDHDSARLERPLSMQLHVECEDCHNPHASRTGPPLISFDPSNPMGSDRSRAPFVNGSLLGVTGITSGGSSIPEAEYEYEVCFKCHGVPGKNACGNRRCQTATGYNMVRQDGVYNLREKFDPGNPTLISYHPVVANEPSNNSEVLSLRKDIPLNQVSSQIYCSDCHSSDTSPAAGGVGSAGPHGSRYESMLALRYEFDPQSSFNSFSGNLCLKCHDAGSLYNDESFPHRKHVLEENASCINCHDPHGSARYPHLINFLTSSNVAGRTFTITGTGSYNEPSWFDKGRYSGTCYLNCHGTVHDGTEYGTAIAPPDSGTPPNGITN